jgi:amino acid adenylation domain-containing protein
MGEVTIQPMRVETGTSKFDLTMFVGEVGEQLEVSLEYSTDLFDAERIERMAGHYQRLLEDIVEHPEKKIWELELLTETEKHQILVEWNDTAADYPKDKCVHQLFEEQVERTPDAVAVVFGEEQLTYRELNERANQLGHYLQKLGVGPEVLVGICVERSLEMIVGLLGILKAGGAYVPLDPSYPRERLKYMLEDTQAPILLTQATLELDLTLENTGVVYLDRDWEEIARLGSDNPKSDVQPENLIYVIYTSGSTGKPKGAMNIHIGVVNRLLWMRDALGFNATDRILQKTPFSFDVSVWELFLPILTGAVLVFAKPEGHKDPQYLVELIQEVKITALHFVPSMLQVFLEVDNLADRCSSLQRVICSGEALPSILQETYYSRTETKLYNLYGPTEAAVDVTWWACRSADDLRSVPIGKPVANTQIYILDHYFNPAPVGVPGELYIGGVQVGRGYFNKPELTQERFIADPFGSREKGKLYKTGDEVKWLVNGDIEYLGRLDNQVKIRGLRIELGEIEKVISEFEAVKEAVVLTIDNVNKEKSIVAYVVASVTADIRDSLTKHLKAKLPEYMLPSYFSFLDAIPLTPNGKADRKVLLEMNRDSLLYVSSKPYVAPRTRTEQLLAEIWKDVLKIERISAHDNFFELGGHSILLMQVLFRIQKTFQTKMAVRELFEARILSDLAGIIDRTPRNNTQPLEKVSRVLEDVD